MDIKRGGSPDSNLNFYDQMVRVEKGWVEHEFVLFIICCIATWNKVAKWVNILQDISLKHRAILLEATSYIYVIRKLWKSWPTRVGSNWVTSVNTHKYILLMYLKNVCLKRNKKTLYFIKSTSFNDVLRSVFIYFLP